MKTELPFLDTWADDKLESLVSGSRDTIIQGAVKEGLVKANDGQMIATLGQYPLSAFVDLVISCALFHCYEALR